MPPSTLSGSFLLRLVTGSLGMLLLAWIGILAASAVHRLPAPAIRFSFMLALHFTSMARKTPDTHCTRTTSTKICLTVVHHCFATPHRILCKGTWTTRTLANSGARGQYAHIQT